MVNEASGPDELERLNEEAKDIARLIDDALQTLHQTHDNGQWPYKIEHDSPADSAPGRKIRPSTSTTAMVAFALAAVDGRFGADQLLVEPTNHWRADQHEGAASRVDIVNAASRRLLGELAGEPRGQVTGDNERERLTTIADDLAQLADRHVGDSYRLVRASLRDARDIVGSLLTGLQSATTHSSLFGRDDPMTLYWSLAVLGLDPTQTDGDACRRLRTAARDVIERTKRLSGYKLDAERPDVTQVPHPWVHLRLLHLTIDQGLRDQFDQDEVTQYLLDFIAKQLSWSDIRDSNFDEASLIFALEAALLWTPRSVTPGLLERATHVVREVVSNPALQSRQPFKVTETGGVHIPINVEVASSLLRVCTRARREFGHDDVFFAVLPVLRRYVAWVRATVTSVTRRGVHHTGWRSDHEYFAARHIETWYTSQIALFLHNYREALLTHVAARGLARERLSTVAPSATSDPDADLRERDPGSGLFGRRGQPFTVALEEFVVPRRSSSGSAACSMLLYGPPGTGKSSSVRLLAAALRYPLTIISPSNFISRGEQEVEATAKALFNVLEMQSNLVVLFDEIDRLILDRRNEQYHRQGDMFQLMTPSMLTKFETLRRLGRVIFAIGTNYGYRIDPAIIRPGRVDQQLLILPPDRARRHELLAAEFQGDPSSPARHPAVDLLAERTPLYTEAELKALVGVFTKTTGDLPSRCDEAVRTVRPAIRLDDYGPETPAHGDNPLFLAETASVGAILAEVGAPARVNRGLAEAWQRQQDIVEAMLGSPAADTLKDWVRSREV